MNKILIPQQDVESPHFPLFVELEEELKQTDEWVRIEFDKVKLLIRDTSGMSRWIEAKGEFHVIANITNDADILNENGEPYEIDSLYIPELKVDDFIPHGGEKLVLYLDHPEYFLDIHMLVMEGNAGNAPLVKIIEETPENSHLSLFFYKGTH